MNRCRTKWLVAGVAVFALLLSACQTTETAMLGGDDGWLDVWRSSFVSVPTTEKGSFEGRIDILGTGMGSETTLLGDGVAELAIADLASVQRVRLQVALKFPTDAAAVTFTNQLGDVLAGPFDYDSDFRTVSGAFFETTLEVVGGRIGSVDLPDGVIRAIVNDAGKENVGRGSYTPRSFVALVFRSEPDVEARYAVSYADVWSGDFDDYVVTTSEALTIPGAPVDRELSVGFALSDLQMDSRPIEVVIEVGGAVVFSQSFAQPNALEELLLKDGVVSVTLPAGLADTIVELTVTSPPGGDSVWPVAFTANVRDLPDIGCTLTRGYWQTHSKYGPAPYDATWALFEPAGEDTTFFLSGQSAYEVLWTPPRRGNAYYVLAPQWIAAYLNVLNGASIGPVVLDAWNAATMLFETYTPAQVGARGFSGRGEFVRLAGILDAYNNGLSGTPHCSD